MQFNKMNFALAAGFTGAIMSLLSHLMIRYMMGFGMRQRMMYMLSEDMPTSAGYPMMGGGWGMIITPITTFIIAALAGWLFAFFYNMLEKKSSLR